jgi:1,4-alpha-glucan branching enzyme
MADNTTDDAGGESPADKKKPKKQPAKKTSAATKTPAAKKAAAKKAPASKRAPRTRPTLVDVADAPVVESSTPPVDLTPTLDPQPSTLDPQPSTLAPQATPVAEAAELTRAPSNDVSRDNIERLLAGDHTTPHAILGAHPAVQDGEAGVVIRTLTPGAVRGECLFGDGRVVQLFRTAEGLSDLYVAFIAGETLPLEYRFRFYYADDAIWERGDPYRFLPTLGDVDVHLFNEGTHRELWKKLGAHVRTVDGTTGVSFAVWAPNARRVSVIGDFSGWDGRIFPMRMLGSSGVWELFIPEIGPQALYKYEILTREGLLRVKTDPFAAKIEQPPGNASIVQAEADYHWGDDDWMAARRETDPCRSAMSIYEVHIGSWMRVPEHDGRMLTYRELAPRLARHVTELGFTHVEFLPVMEHPFYGSWGYQVSGYYAPSSRWGTPDDFRFLVDTLHQYGIGVILDWVPAHFPKDDYALRRFDGTALYEHDDPRLGEHPDWGTLIFNYGRNEVRNFLIANALFWLKEFHADGLRVDAVASMLYLDYSREPGQWLRNRQGGRENLDAIAFLKQFNEAVRVDAPGAFTVAEESTAWPNVTTPVKDGGLGFTLKWNMGWMHDTLAYFALDPIHRRFHHDQLTFAMLYEYSERFIMPLSHDEVVHLKGSLLAKLPGDEWQKLSNLRLLLTYMFTRPGKKLLFMGTEFAPWTEWNHDRSLDWHLLDDQRRIALCRFVSRLAALYKENPVWWRDDPTWDGFTWIDVADRENSVISYARRDGDAHAIVMLNLTPVPRERYRVGVPAAVAYEKLLSSDDAEWGGTGLGAFDRVECDAAPFHGYPQSIEVSLPPLAALVLAPVRD